MPRVMIVGAGPLPRPNSTVFSAGALRTRQLLDALLPAGFTVNLFTLPALNGHAPENAVPAMLPDNFEGLTYQRFTNVDSEFAIRALAEQARQLQPDALLGVGSYPAYLAAMLPTTIPLWVDFHGHWMSEAQGRSVADGNDARLPEAWAIERALVRRLDKFSAISRPLLHLVLGELASVGRFNQFTYHYQFGHHLPMGAWRWPQPSNQTPAGETQGPVLRGPIVPTDAFVVLWGGPFESWSDPATLVAALNPLMEQYPTVHCVMTGGRMEGVARPPQQVFEELIEQAPTKDRYHLLGPVESEQLAQIYREADLGVVLDGRNYETLFGAHWRIAAMSAERLALALTPGTELGEWLEDSRAALPVAMGDVVGLTEAIEPWIEQREELARLGTKARQFMEDNCAPMDLGQRLSAWLREPKLAPDNHAKLELDGTVVTDLNAVYLNGLEEQNLMLMRYRPSEMQQALADWEARTQRSRNRFTFGLRKP